MDKYIPYTIGFSTKIIDYIEDGHNFEQMQIGLHDKVVCCRFSPHTDDQLRPKGKNRIDVVKTLSSSGIENISAPFDIRGYMEREYIRQYYSELSSYKFMISPFGFINDCHRHYESIVVGTIPVIEYSDEIRDKYEGCPILWTDDYSEINHDYLLNKYEEMIDKEFDFSKIFIYNYSVEYQKEIVDHSNYWVGEGRMGNSFYE